jgi:2-polyprenyl-6-methoxyphenol hydroxylase-like FAD-dependent oxidoreductase
MTDALAVTCCIAGGGPAGMVLGVLLARAGVDVVVLEKHGDFLRDFRGDTIHPSTLEIMNELGWIDDFLKLPHRDLAAVRGQIGDTPVTMAEFRRLPVRCRFIAFMPQWDFLDFLARRGRAYPGFRLLMNADLTDLIEDDGRVRGARVTTPDGPLEIWSDLVVGADGRHSTVRARAGLPARDFGAPMDVFWFRLSRHGDEEPPPLGRIEAGRIFVALDRGTHWQCGYVIAKGQADVIRARGLDAFRADVARLAPFAASQVDEIKSWDDVKLLTVQVDRLERWMRPGVLCIGDAAHAMSPIGGVGINLAVQDAVAAANRLAAPLREHRVTLDDLRAIQRRREWPARATQRIQLFLQRRVIARVLASSAPVRAPRLLLFLVRIPLVRQTLGRVLGLGVRPEHVATDIIEATPKAS